MDKIKILGTGCPKCIALEKVTKQAVEELSLQVEISKVEDIIDIMKYNLLRTPGLVMNEKVILSGRVPTVSEVKKLLI
jgi:small redox-active disulfide protein 2